MFKKLLSFKGGIHPPGNKELTKDKVIVDALLPETVDVLMAQHIGAPAKPIVEKGDLVKVGQLIGEAQGFISSNFHAPISGTVKEIGFRPHPITGARTQAVIIKGDGKDEYLDGVKMSRGLGMPKEEIVEMVKKAGIVGLGGATFPAFVKLLPPKDVKIDTLIINAAECEPYLTCDYRLMMEFMKEVIVGANIIMKCLGLNKAYMGIEDNKKDVCEKVKYACEVERAWNMVVEPVLLGTKYPQGAEHQIVKAIMGRIFKKLPSEVGCVVMNVSTVYAIYEAVKFNIPLVERVITITGDGVERPGNYRVRIGTPIKDLLDMVGLKEGVNKIILGGPMMGIAVKDIDGISTIKGTGGILVMKNAEIFKSQACIRCGKCIEVCPYGLNPSLLGILCEAGKFQEALDNNLMDCKECGCCSFVCNASRDNVNRFKAAKFELGREKAREQVKNSK